MEVLRAIASVFSMDVLSPFPQYWAANMLVPMVSAARNRLYTNVSWLASDTADSKSCSIVPTISASEALTTASINC